MENDPVQLNASYLHLEFSRIADRFIHRLGWQSPDGLLAMLESVPGNSQQPWPSDPPLQHVVCESMGNTEHRVVLGVGMSGHGHWSVAVEVQLQPDPTLRWDWACKIQRPATQLLSTYRIADPWTIRIDEASPSSCWLHHPKGLSARCGVETGRLVIDSPDGLIRILPSAELVAPSTVRWCYAIRAY